MSYPTSSVQRQPFQFDIDGCFYSSFKPPVFSGQDIYIVVLRGIIFRLQMSVESWPEELGLWCCMLFVYGEVVLLPQCTNLCSPGCIEQHKLHYTVYAWCFVLRMDKFLPQCVGLKLTGTWCLLKISQMFCYIRNEYVVRFSHLLLSVWFGSFRGKWPSGTDSETLSSRVLNNSVMTHPHRCQWYSTWNLPWPVWLRIFINTLLNNCFVCRFILENWVLDRWVRNILTVYPVVIVALVGNIMKHFNPADPTTNSVFMGEFNILATPTVTSPTPALLLSFTIN